MITPISTVATREDLIAMIHMRDALVSDLKEAHAAAEARAIAAETRVRDAITNFKAIRQATIDGRVCDDVAWFDTITTLHDFCELAVLQAEASAPPVAGQPIGGGE